MRRTINTSWYEAADALETTMSTTKFGYDIPGTNAVIIWDVNPTKPSWALYDGQACIAGRRDGESYQSCKEAAKAWFDAHGGREKWPSGLELRVWNA
jgi:hypothetical protein